MRVSFQFGRNLPYGPPGLVGRNPAHLACDRAKSDHDAMPFTQDEPERGSAKDYWEDRLRGGADLGSVGYRGLGLAYNRWMYRVRGRAFDRVVKRLDISLTDARILDIGSGSGYYVDNWIAHGAIHVVGSDFTDASIAGLRKRFPSLSILQLDISAPSIDVQPESFDIVSAMDVLFHITDDDAYRRALVNIQRVLRPGGLFLFSENFLHGPSVVTATQVSRPITTIESEVKAAGFEIVTRVAMFVLMNYPIDSKHRVLQLAWRHLARLIRLHEIGGQIFGVALWPLEGVLLRLVREGPSTELMLCVKTRTDPS